MALDEYIYGKIANFFSRRAKATIKTNPKTVKLDDIKPRLNILARAVTGNPIDIYPAKREGGYKNNNFFLPVLYSEFQSYEENLSFYLFRVLYLSIQKNTRLNWHDNMEHSLEKSQEKALNTSSKVLTELFVEFPISQNIYQNLIEHYQKKKTSDKSIDYSFIYGKWMLSTLELSQEQSLLKHFNDKAKKAISNEVKTILKATPVEEVMSLQIDKKQQEDYVMTHNFEKIDTAEEWDGGWRDLDGEDELDEHNTALEELNMKYTVRVEDTTHSVYQSEFVENTTVAESKEINTENYYFSYDEWDYNKRQYKENFCKLYPKTVKQTDQNYYKKTIKDNTSTLLGLRKILTNINNKFQQQRRQNQGEEFDIDALTDLFIDVHTGHTPSENIYLSKRKKEKDLSILMLLDISLSADSYAAGNRVIDVEKQVSILFGEILNEFQVDFSIGCFYSKTRNHASYLTIKSFDDHWDKAKYKVGAIEPEGYTRIGTALRHSGALLDQRESKNKWVILISDGKPNDYDKYEGKYGISDVKQAIRELNQRNINSYALAIEANAKYYLPQMFGVNHYEILTTPVELLQSLTKLYDRIKYKS